MSSALIFSGLGLGFGAYTISASLAPSGATPDDVVRVDLTGFPENAERQYRWKQYPVLVRHRTLAEIRAMQAVELGHLHDSMARRIGQPDRSALDSNRTIPGNSQWLVVVAVCTYRNCILRPYPTNEPRPPDETWICPCCASRYDASGRVRSGPAPHNLSVPPYRLQGATLEIGVS